MPSKDYALDWTYNEFSLLEELFFPLEMDVSLTTPKQKLNVSMMLSSITLDKSPSFDRSIPSGYSKVELKEVVKLLVDK